MTRTRVPRAAVWTTIFVAIGLAVVGIASSDSDSTAATAVPARPRSAHGLHKIKHVIIVMQENRSFDNYFGTFPDADGIPMRHGRPVVCVPDPRLGHCVRPYHDTKLVDAGGPHSYAAARTDINGGRMDGFVRASLTGWHRFCLGNPHEPQCVGSMQRAAIPDVVGYHTAAEIPNYWAYARRFVLQDHLFEGVRSWSLPSHLDMVSGWSAWCSDPRDPMSCKTYIGYQPGAIDRAQSDSVAARQPYAWTDITYLLDRYHVSWRYFVANGSQPDCAEWPDRVPSATAVGVDARHLEPSAGVPHRPAGRAGVERPARPHVLPDGARGNPAVGQLGRAQRPPQRTPTELDRRGAGMGDAHRELVDAQPGLEQHGSSCHGTTGVGSMTMSRRAA